jgi:hypothetical protein
VCAEQRGLSSGPFITVQLEFWRRLFHKILFFLLSSMNFSNGFREEKKYISP